MTTIKLPDNLIAKLEVRAKERKFTTVDAYIQMILEGVVTKLENTKKEMLSSNDEALVKDRLRRLGYID